MLLFAQGKYLLTGIYLLQSKYPNTYSLKLWKHAAVKLLLFHLKRKEEFYASYEFPGTLQGSH
jgi:hypothetical protein